MYVLFQRRVSATLQGKGKYVRLRSVDHAIAELLELKARYSPVLIYFVDDVIGFDVAWTEEFLARYAREVGIPFLCNTHVRYVTDDFAKQLAEAKCISVQFGLESGNDDLRKRLLGRQCTRQEILDAAERIHRNGLKFTTFNILGCPGETTEQAFETIDLNTQIKVDFPSFSLFIPFPQTPLHDYAVEHGYIKETDIDHFPASFYFDTAIQQPTIKELLNLQRLYLPAIRFPRLRFLIRWLIKLPPNKLFDWIYLTSFGLQYARRTNRGILRTFRLGLMNLRFWRS